MSKVKLSIIVPVYNEENTIIEVLKKLQSLKFTLPVKKEIIIVDDGSSDNSQKVIADFLKKNHSSSMYFFTLKKNRGKGYAVIYGIKKSSGDLITIQDADLEYDPNDLAKLLKVAFDENAQVVYGTRLKNYPLRLAGARKTPLISHYLGNKFLTIFTNLLYGSSVTDMETCYKMFRKDVIDNLALKSRRFEFEAEITAKIIKKGIRIYEVPIRVKPRGYNEGKKITWRDGFMALWTLLKYRFVN